LNTTEKSLANKNNSWLAAFLLVGSLALLFWLDYSFLLPLKEVDANDVTFFWSGTRTVLLGGNPYDPTPGSLYHQIRVEAGGDPQFIDAFKSPVLLTLFFMPLAALPLSLAAALWTLITQALLAISVFWVIKGAGLASTPGRVLAGIGMVLLWRYTFLVMIVGNLSLLLLFAIVAAWYASLKHHPYLAGAATALLLVKPQVTFLIVPLLLVLPIAGGKDEPADWKGRASLRRLIGFGLVSLFLMSYSFAVQPDWVGQMAGTLFGSNQSYFNNQDINNQLTSLRSVVAAVVPDAALVQPVAIVVAVPLWLGAGWLWWRFRNNLTAAPFLLAIVTGLNILTSPYIRDYDSAILLFGLLFCFFTLQRLEKNKLFRGKWSWWCWGLAFLPYPVHFLAAGTSYAFENLITLLYLLLVALTWRGSKREATTTPLITGEKSLTA
jgi:hypothetical protein